jgi:hypothetical protein
MSRPLRIQFDEAVYHVMNRETARQATFVNDQDYGEFLNSLVDQDEYLAQVARYIHLNPIGAGVVEQPEQYRWSSHGHYLKPKGAPEWLNTEEVLEQIGGSRSLP